jgi:hypothetical protein
MPLDAARWQIEIAAADRTAQAFASVERRMKSLEVKQAGLSASMNLGATAAGVASRGVVGLVSTIGRFSAVLGPAFLAWQTFKAGMESAQLIDQAEQLGVAMESLQAYRAVAMQTGVTTEQFDGALQKLTGSIGAANGGSDEAIRTFDRLGVKLLDGHRRLRPIDDLLPEIARGLLGVDNATERAALAQDIFGRSGQRLLTMLPQLAGGADALTEATRRQGMLVERDAAEAWNKLDTQLQIVGKTASTTLAALGAPIATQALEAVNAILTAILANLDRLKREAATAAQAQAQRAAAADVKQLEDQLAAARQRQAQFRPGSTGYGLEQGSIDALNRRLDAAREAEKQARQATMEAEEAAARADKLSISQPPPTTGVSNPAGKTAGAAVQKLDQRLHELQAERAALETALAAFDRRGGESVEAIDKRLDAQVKLDKRIFDVLKDVPANSPLAAQLTQEATAIARLNQQLGDRKKLLKIDEDAEQFIAAQKLERDTLYMSTEAALAYRLEQEAINRAKAEGIALTPELVDHLKTLAAAQAAAAEETRRAREWVEFEKQTFRGFFADLNQGLREGATVWDAFGNAGLNALNRIADKLIEMAADDLFTAAFGGSGGVGGIFSGVGDWLGGVFDSGPDIGTGFNPGFTGLYAEGGDYPAGQPRIVGENGWELDVPRTPGTVLNQRQLRRMLGGGAGDGREGGVSVTMPVTMHFGSNLTRAEMATFGEQIRAEVPKLAVAAILSAKSSSMGVRRALKR